MRLWGHVRRVLDLSEVGGRGNSVTAREMLDRGAERIRGDLAEDPLVQAQLMRTMGEVYREMGLFAQAQPLLEQALSLQRVRLEAGRCSPPPIGRRVGMPTRSRCFCARSRCSTAFPEATLPTWGAHSTTSVSSLTA